MNGDTELIDFTRTLKTITSNDKYLIDVLCKMAMDVRDNQTLSKEISKLAMNNIFKVEAPLKLSSFYVVDSIIKNVGSPYKEMFSEEIIDAFVHTFQANKDHRIRIKLYNLRLTWKEYFPPDLMNNLDEEVKKFDPAWPLVVKFNQKHKTDDKNSKSHEVSNSTKSSLDSKTLSTNPDPVIYKIESLKEVDYSYTVNKDELFTIGKGNKEHINKLLVKNEPSVNCDPMIFKIKSVRKVYNKDELLMIDKNNEEEVNELMVNKKLCVNSDPKISEMKSEEKVSDESKVNKPELFTIDNKSKKHIKNEVENKKQLFDIKPDENKELLINNLFSPRDLDLRIYEGNQQREEERNEKGVPEISVISPNLLISQSQEPSWRIKINGFPQMPPIGTDPRLLSRCPFHDPVRMITIDGTSYDLHLDRIQPCIFVNNELRAIRFHCSMMKISIDGTMFIISANGFANIQINGQFYIATLGGPGHELIINGWPYNVPTDGNSHQITVNGYPASVQFHIQKQLAVTVQNAIPSFICDWAVKGFFGSPQYLNMPPLNPLKNRKLRDTYSFQFHNELLASTSLTNFIE